MADRYNRFSLDENSELELDVNTILTEEFDVESLGYSVVQVDRFLDRAARDYNTYENLLNKCVDLLNELKRKNDELQTRNDELSLKLEKRENNGADSRNNASSLSQVDILRRIARLEQEIFNKK